MNEKLKRIETIEAELKQLKKEVQEEYKAVKFEVKNNSRLYADGELIYDGEIDDSTIDYISSIDDGVYLGIAYKSNLPKGYKFEAGDNGSEITIKLVKEE